MYPAWSGGSMCRSYRSAKSVACRGLKVVGVSRLRFFPRRIVSLTRSEEFHSVKKTRYPPKESHLRSNWAWVDFPEPSRPSKTTRRPGYGRFHESLAGTDDNHDIE